MFKDKIAIVTGGSEGIGFGIARGLSANGAHVILVSRTLEKLLKAKELIAKNGGKADVKPADITDINAVKAVIEEVYAEHGRLDIFVNNAGIWKGHGLDSEFVGIWKLIEFDMKAPFEIAHYLLSRFKDVKDNNLQVLTTVSQAALRVLPGSLGYGVAKMGLAAALFHLQKELEKDDIENITLYRLYPDSVGTPKMVEEMREHGVMNVVSVQSVADLVLDMLDGKTPTRDARIGYHKDRGIVRTFYTSEIREFYDARPVTSEVIDADFKPEDLLKDSGVENL